MIIIMMGVSGVGKTTIGEYLAKSLQIDFIEGDDLHPEENIKLMREGTALTDEDREPWLDRIVVTLNDYKSAGHSAVLSCSSLKRAYRDKLRQEVGTISFIYLRGDEETLLQRMKKRSAHFMPTSLLQSQLSTLEEPTADEGIITIDVDETLEVLQEIALKAVSEDTETPALVSDQ